MKYLNKIEKKYHQTFDLAAGFKNASEGKIILVQSQILFKYSIRKRFTNEYGESSMHISRDCILPYPVSFYLQKNSPFTEIVSNSIQKVGEAGLIDYWLNSLLDMESPITKRKDRITELQAVSLINLAVLILLYAAGITFSVLCFLLELKYRK